MENKGKIVLVCICVAMLMVISVIGTLAFANQTVTGKDHLGTDNVEIVLTEDISIDGVGTVNENNEQGTVNFNNITPGDRINNTIKVENTANTPAYVAVTVTINNADKIINGYKKSNDENIVVGCGIAYDPVKESFKIGDYPIGAVKHIDFTETFRGEFIINQNNWFKTDYEEKSTSLTDYTKGYYTFQRDDGFIAPMADHQLRYTYYIYLEGGADCVVFEGLNVPDSFDKEEMAMFRDLKIDIHSASVEANGAYNETEAKNAFQNLYVEVTP